MIDRVWFADDDNDEDPLSRTKGRLEVQVIGGGVVDMAPVIYLTVQDVTEDDTGGTIATVSKFRIDFTEFRNTLDLLWPVTPVQKEN